VEVGRSALENLRRLLVIGGTGFIGSHLVSAALSSGFEVTVLSKNRPTVNKKIKGVDYLESDINNLSQLKNQLISRVFDYVVNLSGYIDHTSFLDGGKIAIDTHFNGVQNIVQSLNRTALRKFIQIGSSDEYGTLPSPQIETMRESPISPYSLGKVASTHLLQMLYKTEKFPSVILRLFLVYGPGQDDKRFIPQVIKGCLSKVKFPASTGRQIRDFCYIDDITRGILISLENDKINGEVINLASGKSIYIKDVITKVREIVGYGFPEFGAIPLRLGESSSLFADIEKANKFIKWTPEISIDYGLKRTIKYFSDIREGTCAGIRS
jgi:nucleoside-diphosphate-sugar epimerase